MKKEPWIETRQGSWFFVNALLVAPELVVLFPLTVGLILGFLVPERGPSPFIDTIPFVASKSIPILGWLLVIPVWTTLRSLRTTSWTTCGVLYPSARLAGSRAAPC